MQGRKTHWAWERFNFTHLKIGAHVSNKTALLARVLIIYESRPDVTIEPQAIGL